MRTYFYVCEMLTRMVACSWEQAVSRLLVYFDKFCEHGYAFKKD